MFEESELNVGVLLRLPTDQRMACWKGLGPSSFQLFPMWLPKPMHVAAIVLTTLLPEAMLILTIIDFFFSPVFMSTIQFYHCLSLYVC